MSIEGRTIDCATHGASLPTYVCTHLLVSMSSLEPTGLTWLRDEDECVNAYCDECAKKLADEGGEWNDAAVAFANIRLVCATCFEKVGQINGIKDLN